MTDKEILQKVIEKAEENEFNLHKQFEVYDFYYNADKKMFIDDDYAFNGVDERYIVHKTVSLKEVIFSHEFAKAFWGERNFTVVKPKNDPTSHPREKSIYNYDKPAWQYHLQQMVMENEPLKYLEKFL